MAYKKYPWHKFERWLNKQNPRALAGDVSMVNNVISEFLRDAGLDTRMDIRKDGLCNAFPDQYLVPRWCKLMRVKILVHGCTGHVFYQFRTVKKWLAEVKQEWKDAQTTGN